MDFLDLLRIVFGLIYLLFLPGFLLSFLFFKSNWIWLERILISIGLSMAIVPVAIFLMNLIGFKLTTLNIFLEILLILAVLGGLIAFYGKKIFNKKNT
ncbi:DUF1616 domain-containing protein [Patescibacteria group bacterium]|nr:DUF1616 domain-containing protein [Patescibacteria group bacterium]MBU1673245.1 DUF1616 domain-containing protein [Patescibacteria group bacterium]MBU1963506.1 DUF1616 domain-containing protein [Patescibacteria group bacterium]